MIKVLYVIDSLRAGGKEKQLVELVSSLKRTKKIVPFIISFGEDKFYEDKLLKSKIPVTYIKRKIKWDLLVFYKIIKYIKKIKPHIVQTNCWMTTAYFLPICKILKIKLVNNTIRNAFYDTNIKWKLEKLFLLLSDYRISNSKAGFKSRHIKLNKSNNFVIYNGYNIKCLQNVERKDSEKMVVGMVAEFKNHKDYDTYLKAAKKIIEKRNDIIFYAIGGGENLGKYRKTYEKYSENIIFTGRVKNVEEYIKKFDIGVLATYTEGISNSIMEYMASSKPVIATDGGGTKELVINNMTGILVPKKNVEILIKKIEYLLDNQIIRYKMGELGRERIKTYFNMDRLIKKTILVYQNAYEKFDL